MPSRDLLGVLDPARCPSTGIGVAQVPHEEQNLQTRGFFRLFKCFIYGFSWDEVPGELPKCP